MVHEIDNHLESFAAAEASDSMSANAMKLFSVCNAYQKIRPIIIFVKGLIFWRPKWQKAIDEFIEVADGICPQ